MIVDLFGGPGGWAEGLRLLGLEEIGIELDRAACATRRAAGHRVIRADVARMPLGPLASQVAGLIGSPPCPTFSAAGKGAGRVVLEDLGAAIVDALAGRPTLARHRKTMARVLQAEYLATPGIRRWPRSRRSAQAWYDASQAALTVQPARWIAATRPRWVALEQVPAVLALWRVYARELRAYGYGTWAGILNAADYGVPQTRRRAILLASLDRVVAPPEPTHTGGGADTLFGRLKPWVSMAEALGWTGEDTPARTLCGDRSPRWMYPDTDGTHGRQVGFPRRDDRGDSPDGYRVRDWHPDDAPSPVITEKARSMVVRTGSNSMVTGRTGSRAGDGDVQAYERPITEPAPTVDTKAGSSWRLVNTNQTHRERPGLPRPLDHPAPTLAFGHTPAAWVFSRPATTIAGDPRVFPPGGHLANDGRDNSKMVGRSQTDIRLSIADALVLQGFPPDYPVEGSKTKQFEQVGNAVPPPLAAAVIAQLLDDRREVSA